MKRFLCMALALLLTLGLCACGEKEPQGENAAETAATESAPAALRVGFGRENITPESPVVIAGGGDSNRVSNNTLDPITVTCVAITDADDNTLILITQDTVDADEKHSGGARDMVSQATGVPASNIIISGTHTHSSGTLGTEGTGVIAFTNLYYDGVIRAAKKAINDRAPATAATGTAQAEDLVFVRRYYLDDGTVKGASGNTSTSTTITKHVYDANETIQLVHFLREGKKDILLTNLGAHATFNGETSMLNLSADFPAGIRGYIESNLECHVAYFIGAAADQTPTTEIPSEDHKLTYYAYGEKIGEIICNALPTLKPIQGGTVQVLHKTHTGKTYQIENPDRLSAAQSLWGMFKSQGFAASEAAAKAQGFAGIYETMAIVNRAKQKPTRDIPVVAACVGDISFIAASYEMYSITGADIIARSPFENTFIITCANGKNGYIPSAIGYELQTYEAYNSWMAPGTGEDLADLFVEMLNELK